MRMPFGQYAGERLDDLDESYLDWLLTVPNLSPKLRREVCRQLFLQDRAEWLESAACVLPRILWQWITAMQERYGDDGAACEVVVDALAVLEQLCSEFTGTTRAEE